MKNISFSFSNTSQSCFFLHAIKSWNLQSTRNTNINLKSQGIKVLPEPEIEDMSPRSED